MSQQEIETILARQLASYLAMPIFIIDPVGTLLYYNEPAEIVLGRRYEETGKMPMQEWTLLFTPTDEGGAPLAPEQLPLVSALTQQRPVHRRFWISGLDQKRRLIEVTAFPLIGQAERCLGAVAIFWEVEAR